MIGIIDAIFDFLISCSWGSRELKRAVKLIKRGDVVAAPTDTVYGLFADATNDLAIQKIYKIKGRPSCNPLIIHVFDLEMASQIAEISGEQKKIINHFWKGQSSPITFVLKSKSKKISKFVTAGLPTIALRCPNHEIPLQLIQKAGVPLAAPSANTSTSVSPTSYKMVKNDLGGKIPLILDGGECNVGLESTILDLTKKPYVILRPGGVSRDEIEEFLHEKVLTLKEAGVTTVTAPGMMKKHYSPKLPLRINAAFPTDREAFIAFGKVDIDCDINLSKSGNLNEAAKNLFSCLKKLDNPSKYKGIAVMPIPNTGIGVAINDRLSRAAASSN